jgi:cysteine-rich repeat protein
MVNLSASRASPRGFRPGGLLLRWLRVALATALGLGLAAPAAASITAFKQLSSNGVEDLLPRVSGERVAWQRDVGRDAEIMLYDGAAASPLTSNAVHDVEPWISGARVLWKRSSDGQTCSLQLFDGDEVRRVDSSFDCDNDARLAGPFAIWTDRPNLVTDDVLLYDDEADDVDDLGEFDENEREARVGNDGGSPTALWRDGDGLWFWDGGDAEQLASGVVAEHQLWRDRAVWVEFDGDDEEVFLFDGDAVVQLTDNDSDDDQPQVYGDHVVWRGRSGADTEIFHFDGTDVAPLTDDALNDRSPQVSMGADGVTIAWTKDDGNDDELWMFDGCESTRLTDNAKEDLAPSLDGNVVAWVQGTGDGAEVWRAKVECEPYCGDGSVDPGEACDDGNATGGDGCDAACQLECGNGALDGDEQCDDGDLEPGDGCSPLCGIEECGNAVVDFGEECDDGNTADLDGCDALCRLECGNGVPEGAEECDDGDRESGDGCSSECLAEVCGNDRVDFGEECDDGNLLAGDGCDPACQAEAPASKAVRRCIQALNQSGAAVAKAQHRVARECLDDAAAGAVGELGVPATPQACLANDPDARVAEAQAATVGAEAKKCDPAELPPFGYAGAAAVNAAGEAEPIGLVADVFGPDLGAAVIADAADPAGARCQEEVAKGTAALADALFKLAVGEKKRLLKGKPDGSLAVSNEALQAALFAYVESDPKGKAAAKEAALRKAAVRRCGAVALDLAFPGGAPSASVDALVDCAAAAARCRFCRALNAFDGIAMACDDLDDGAANASCP